MKEDDSLAVKSFIDILRFFQRFDIEIFLNELKLKDSKNLIKSYWKTSFCEEFGLFKNMVLEVLKDLPSLDYGDDFIKIHASMEIFKHTLAEPLEVIKKQVRGMLVDIKQEMENVLEDLSLPIALIKFKDSTELRLRTLGKIPQSLFWAAVEGLRTKSGTREVKAFYRRVALISLCGGIPVDLLDTVESFEYKSGQFQSIGLPLSQFEIDDGTLYDIKQVDRNFCSFLEELVKGIGFSEASLRVLFWDPLLVDCFRGTGKPWAVRSELILEKLMDLDCNRRADIAVLITELKHVLFFCEIGEADFFSNLDHKDFAKLNALMTVSCIRLAKLLADKGLDPCRARSFGLLIGHSSMQLAVAHPVFTPVDDGKHEIRVDVSVNQHWRLSFKPSEDDIICTESCCNSAELNPIVPGSIIEIPTHERKQEDLNFLAEVDIGQHDISDDDDDDNADVLMKDEDVIDYVTTVEEIYKKAADLGTAMDICSYIKDEAQNEMPKNNDEPAEQNKCSFNKQTLTKFAIFINVIQKYIKELMNLKLEKGKKVPEFDPPNLAYVHVASKGTNMDTPIGKQIFNVHKRTEQGNSATSYSLMSNTFHVLGLSTEEAYLYLKKMGDYFCFPRVNSSHKRQKDGLFVMEFERMMPLMGNGVFGPYGEGELFGPHVRAQEPMHLILDACTFAVHALYGLNILHEKIGYVHGDISPENVMFSPIDGIWKLNDFGASLPVDKSLETVRQCGTKSFIAPESQKTGIFTKASDIYALGQVLWRIFHIQIMWMVGFEDLGDQVEQAYDEFREAVALMIQESPADRPSAISCIIKFDKIIQDNPLSDFEIYGSDKIMFNVRQLHNEFHELEISEIPHQNITTNIYCE